MSRPAVPHGGPALCGEAPAPSPEGGPGFQETGNREKICKTVKSSRRTAAGARPPCAPLRRAEPRLPRYRAPLPRYRVRSPDGSERRSPRQPRAPSGGSRWPRAPPWGQRTPGSARAQPRFPRAAPAPAAPSSGHPRGAQPRSPGTVPVPVLPPGAVRASRGTEPRFPRGPRTRTLPRGRRAPVPVPTRPNPRRCRAPVPSRARPRSRQTSIGAAGAGPVAALTSRQGGQQEHQEAGRQEPLHPALLPPLTAA